MGIGDFVVQGSANIVTISIALFSLPSKTVRFTIYNPSLSIVKVGFIIDTSLKVALLPRGISSNDQLNIKSSPSSSLPFPSRVTRVPILTIWSSPAFDIGFELSSPANSQPNVIINTKPKVVNTAILIILSILFIFSSSVIVLINMNPII